MRHLVRGCWTVAVIAALSGCGGSSAATSEAGGDHGLQGLILRPAKSAPPLALRNFTGRPVGLSAFRGKAVLVTFVYVHCPDVCPLIVAGLAAAQRQLGREARRVQILAVTVDPRRDTPADVRSFLAARDALGRMDYLLGTVRELLPIWKAWQVGVTLGPGKVIAGHSAMVYGITASGRLADVYPSNFSPAQIVHDVPVLARN
ncbi:MAG: SCO family protein [Actinomycetota bacterium]|nr:SCO family protein [Actinomycetota bacterium]